MYRIQFIRQFLKKGLLGLLIAVIVIYLYYEIHSRIYHNQRIKMISWLDLTDEQVMENTESKYPNIPLKYWWFVKEQPVPYEFNSTCAQFPNLYQIDVTNVLWQTVRFTKASLQLFNAYYDARNVTPGINIRIPSMINRINVNLTSYCQIWFEDETKPVIVEIKNMHYMFVESWHMQVDWQYGPYLIECKIPESHKTRRPRAVSIVENRCDNARNLMKVHYAEVPEVKKNFTVCIKGLNFLQEDFSVRLIEWLESVFLMGVDKVFMYNLQMHPNIRKVVDYYVKLGKVDCRFLTLPEGENNIPIIQQKYMGTHSMQKNLDEIIPYNDCFYRNIHLYKYVALLDVDEIIVPQKDYDWNGMVQRAISHYKPGEKFASISARNVYFLDDMIPEGIYSDIPPYMHMLQHVYRSHSFTPSRWYVKSLFNTDYVLTCHNHYPLTISSDVQNYFEMEPEDAHMQHYREDCSKEVNCSFYRSVLVKDTGMWRYKDLLIERTNQVLEEIESSYNVGDVINN